MVTLEVNNSGEVGRPGVQPANMILLWGLYGSVGVRATLPRTMREEERESGDESKEARERDRYQVPSTNRPCCELYTS